MPQLTLLQGSICCAANRCSRTRHWAEQCTAAWRAHTNTATSTPDAAQTVSYTLGEEKQQMQRLRSRPGSQCSYCTMWALYHSGCVDPLLPHVASSHTPCCVLPAAASQKPLHTAICSSSSAQQLSQQAPIPHPQQSILPASRATGTHHEPPAHATGLCLRTLCQRLPAAAVINSRQGSV
jgi:hypothetical protein